MAIGETSKQQVTAERAMLIAEEFIWNRLGDLVGAGPPFRTIVESRPAWSVPLVLAYPSYGPVGEVGRVVVDEERGEILDATPFEEVNANVARLYAEHQAEIEAAFQARKNSPGDAS